MNKGKRAKIVLETLRKEKARRIHPNLLSKWKRTAISGLPELFEKEKIKKYQIPKAHDLLKKF